MVFSTDGTIVTRPSLGFHQRSRIVIDGRLAQLCIPHHPHPFLHVLRACCSTPGSPTYCPQVERHWKIMPAAQCKTALGLISMHCTCPIGPLPVQRVHSPCTATSGQCSAHKL
eukprot:1037049-Pelagomonas_calceolata.AAC.1